MNAPTRQKLNLKKQKSKFMQSAGQYQIDILNEILRILQKLFEMRLVQKMSRPVDMSSKENLIKKFSQKVNDMNFKIRKILLDLSQKTTYEQINLKDKSMYQEVTNKNNEIRKKIRIIENRYNQVFHDGSFKHFKKLKAMFSLKNDIQIINIQDWAITCLDKTNGQSTNCC